MPCDKKTHVDCCDCCPIKSFGALGRALQRLSESLPKVREIPYRHYIPPFGWRPGSMPVGS